MVDLSLRDDRGKEDICPVCLNFSKPTTPKLGHVKKAAVNASCKACALLLKAIRHFHLTDGLVFVGSTSTQYDSVDGTQTAFHPEDEIIVHLDATPSIWYNLPAPRVQFALKGEGNPPFTDVVQLYTPPGRTLSVVYSLLFSDSNRRTSPMAGSRIVCRGAAIFIR